MKPAGCGDGAADDVAPEAPLLVDNRSGLGAIDYRVGTHASLRARMQSLLGTMPALRTRAPDDFTIGLIDAWATVGDVLTFYQERIANESYLGTASERGSLARIGELVGYAPQPGVAATAWLAFTVQHAAGADDVPVTIASGTRVQSMPVPGGLPQTFETTESVDGRAAWNAMRPSLSRSQTLSVDVDRILLQGATTGLKAGDGIVVATTDSDSRPTLRTVATVSASAADQTTWITLRPRTTAGPTVAGSAPNAAAPVIAGRTIASRVVASAQRLELGSARSSRPDATDDAFGGDRFDDPAVDVDPATKAPAPLTFQAPLVVDLDWSPLTTQVPLRGQPIVAVGVELEAFAWTHRLDPVHLFRTLATWTVPATATVYALRTRASMFGHNAPDPRSLTNVATAYAGALDNGTPLDWTPPGDLWNPLLDIVYPRIAASTDAAPSLAALKWSAADGEHWAVATVASAVETGASLYTLTGKATRVGLSVVATSDANVLNASYANFVDYRGSTLLAESESLPLARLPRDDALAATSTIDLDTWVDGLHEGQRLIVSGELDAARGNRASEMVVVRNVEHLIEAGGYTRLTLATALTRAYVRATVTINGNVAAAGHGSAVQEVLGSGDATVASQSFVLRQSPLTQVGAATATGVASTLAIRVNGTLWTEAASFHDAMPRDRIYVTRLEDDGTTRVTFGDGIHGARLPSGSENIVATYRKGIGRVGNVATGALTLMQTRPLGVQAVTNPIAAIGGTDAESADDIRSNASLTLRTIDRIVSLQDYEDFARAFGGIAKALVTWTWHGSTRGVFLTVAGNDGIDVATDGPLYGHLLTAIAAAAEPNVPVLVRSYRRAAFTFGARLLIDRDRDMDVVVAAARAAVRDAFSFARRCFGQGVSRSEIIALLQSVPGVAAVQVSGLRRTDAALFLRPAVALARFEQVRLASTMASRAIGPFGPRPVPRPVDATRLDAALPVPGPDRTIAAAELLTLDARPVDIVATWAEAPSGAGA